MKAINPSMELQAHERCHVKREPCHAIREWVPFVWGLLTFFSAGLAHILERPFRGSCSGKSMALPLDVKCLSSQSILDSQLRSSEKHVSHLEGKLRY